MNGEQQPGAASQRVVSPEDKALAADWLKRIEAACSTTGRREDEKRFADNRKWLRGIDPADGKKLRTNLHFANLAAMRPAVYAKDPEFSVSVTKAVPEGQVDQWRKFGETAESVLDKMLIQSAKLKKRAKRLLTSGYAAGLGWWKVCWQENRKTDPLITNQIKDIQDNLERLARQQDELSDPAAAGDTELKAAKLRETLAGLQTKAEAAVVRAVALDFVLPEDVVVLDPSVLEVGDYERAEALAHRVWMTRDAYRSRFGYDVQKGKSYRAGNGIMQQTSEAADKAKDLLPVWEIWEQGSGRVFTVCEGEDGFCKPPFSPDWTGERWYPFFLLCFNEVDGGFCPLSDIDLTTEVVRGYNIKRDDEENDRKNALPLNVARKGGTLTHDDLERIKNRKGGDLILIEGVGGRPLSDDLWSGALGALNPANYDTTGERTDMEMLVGGGDAARGAVLAAKTATEAEILAQGMRGRSAERTDTIEDMLSDVGRYVLEMCLRKLSTAEVQQMAGADAVWPEMQTPEQVFQMVSLRVRGGSTGKPDRLQDQDRWTKLLPVVREAMGQVGELRATGQEDAAQAVIHLVRETLRRFDERIDIERFLPQPKDGEEPQGQADPLQDPRVQQAVQEMQQQAVEAYNALQDELTKAQQALKDKDADRVAAIEQARINAMRDVEVASVRAPIEAQAKVESARVTSEATAWAQVRVAEMTAAAQPLEPGEAPEAAEVHEPSEASEIAPVLASIAQGQERIAQMVQAAMTAGQQPKPAMQVIHERDPVTQRIVRSYQQPLA